MKESFSPRESAGSWSAVRDFEKKSLLLKGAKRATAFVFGAASEALEQTMRTGHTILTSVVDAGGQSIADPAHAVNGNEVEKGSQR